MISARSLSKVLARLLSGGSFLTSSDGLFQLASPESFGHLSVTEIGKEGVKTNKTRFLSSRSNQQSQGTRGVILKIVISCSTRSNKVSVTCPVCDKSERLGKVFPRGGGKKRHSSLL